jgi:tetratricopeptide (TPR) repeat protein
MDQTYRRLVEVCSEGAEFLLSHLGVRRVGMRSEPKARMHMRWAPAIMRRHNAGSTGANMKSNARLERIMAIWFVLVMLFSTAFADSAAPAAERLGTVAFPVSCAPSEQANFNRGVALLHDFWYAEARPQFERILKSDPHCSMAHWGIAMSVFHQIWDRPDEATMALGRREIAAAQTPPAATAREREYIAALGEVFRAGTSDYQARIDAYSAAMRRLYAAHPEDVDAGAFYALSLLAAKPPADTGIRPEEKAMAVLGPLWSKYPDHPGLVHYIIHACDNPTLAPKGLAAARAYGKVAPSGPHAVHMPGHIFARLGLWQEDIAANTASVEASRAAEARHESGWMDQFHSDDFLVYAYLQSGQERKAVAVITEATAAINHYRSMPDMADNFMVGMFPYYQLKLPIFVDLETRNWKKTLALEPVRGAPPFTQTQLYWARSIAAGHLHQADQAQRDLVAYDSLIAEIRKGRHAYYAQGTGARITRGEVVAWAAFAAGQLDQALATMRESADLQDQVGQGEVDIPAREMLADMLLDAGRPKEALVEYERALRYSPNRFNGLYGAGRAAEASGDQASARRYFAALLAATDNGAESTRPELGHAKGFVATAKR